MLTANDVKNTLVLLNIGMTAGAYNIDQSPVLATVASKLAAMLKELENVKDSDPDYQSGGS